MQKVNKGLLSFVLLLALVLAMAFPALGKVTARADDDSTKKLYYFSDSEECFDYCNNVLPGILAQVGMSGDDIVLHYYPDLESEVKKHYQDELFVVSKNSYIIFEMRKEIARDTLPTNGPLFTDILDELFSTWTNKQNQCKIMLIFGTDEAQFDGYTDFLSYVDVHVNTNIFIPFFYSMMCIIRENWFPKISETNYLLNLPLAGWEVQHPFLNEFYADYLLPYYRCEADDCKIPAKSMDNGELYWDLNRNPNFWHWPEYRSGQKYDNLVDGALSYFVAYSSTEPQDTYYEWEEFMINLRADMGHEFPVFIYDVNGTPLSITGENVYTTEGVYEILQEYIPLIMHDFIVGEDLSVYNNWPDTTCKVMFKPLFASEGGWIRVPVALECFQKYMTEDQKEFYGFEY